MLRGKAAHIPTALHVGLGHQRASLHKLFAEQKLDMAKRGIKQLGKEDQAAANELFDQLRQYGIFAVRNGEVESWLSDLSVRLIMISFGFKLLRVAA
jgi:hypothetical protein